MPPLLLAEAERYSLISGAAFDSRIGALVDAWDLRSAGVEPTADALRSAREAAGSRSISVDESTGTVIRHAAAAWIDTGGFGKSAALRSVARGLESANVVRALIDLGGQLWAHGSADEPWSVHVAHPTERQRPVARLEIQGVSVATSGTSERFIEIDGVRRSPRTRGP
jgi:thiamine biosynthesis lipoprotein